MDDLIAALQIFQRYTDKRNPTHCEHDTLSLMVDPADVSATDTAALEELGFHANEDEKCFYSYRFGSC